MSAPRYDWWPYVKGMIRRYPGLVERDKELHNTSISPVLSGLPRPINSVSDPTGAAALRELPEINRKEMDAVREAIEETQTMKTGKEKMRMIKLVFWDGRYTLEGSAQQCHISYRTARRWHSEFIRLVAKKFGFI
ncbi:MAG: hypothetical protein ACLU62_06275 [Hydrogeniiclostridium sp.]